MKASLIISIYKNIRFLRVVLDSLRYQTEKDFEIIISEDGCDEVVKRLIEDYPFRQPVRHLTQEDMGWRKNQALNRAIAAASANHLIFIDGDVVLHPRFIEMHTKYFMPDLIMSGKRVLLGAKQRDMLLADPTKVLDMQPLIWRSLIYHDGIRRPEEGIFMPWLSRIRSCNYLTGCNMSCSKKALIDINGFDEDYRKPAYGEDTDLVWRFEGKGYKFFSLRNAAVQYHLLHKPSWTDQSENMSMGLAKQARGEFYAKNGLDSHPLKISHTDIFG